MRRLLAFRVMAVACLCGGLLSWAPAAFGQAAQSDPSLGTGNTQRPPVVARSDKAGIDRLARLSQTELGLGGAEVWEYIARAPTPFRFNYSNDSSSKPVLLVYGAPQRWSQEEAWAYMNLLGLIDLAEREAADIYLISPRDGRRWDAERDYSLFDRLQYAIPQRGMTAMANYKLIGLDDGATFVHSVLIDHLQRIAGVLTWGGEMRPEAFVQTPMAKTLAARVPIPTYLAGPVSGPALWAYRAANGVVYDAKPQAVAPGIQAVASMRSPLRRVMVDTRSTTPREAIRAGFTHLLQHNLRLYLANNFWTPDYTQQAMANSTAEGLLLPLIALDGSSPLAYARIEDGVVAGEGGKQWLEFVPKDLLAKGNRRKAPLIVFFHGGGNDNAQVFTSGWPEIAEREGAILVAPEHQFGAMNVEAFIDQIVAKYPVDASRIYATGLSGGGFKTNIVALLMGERFAAVAAFAAGDFVRPGEHAAEQARLYHEPRYPDRIDEIVAEYNARNVVIPYSFSAGSHDRSFPLWYPWADEAPWQVRPMLNLIGRINRIPKLANLRDADIDVKGSGNPVMGVALENQRMVQLIDMPDLVGGFSDADGRELVMMSSPIGLKHWYYYDATNQIWAWMKRFSRDPATWDLYRDGRLIVKAQRNAR